MPPKIQRPKLLLEFPMMKEAELHRVTLRHHDFYTLAFANQATFTQIFDTKENLLGLSPVSTQMADFCADNDTAAWTVVKAQPVGMDPQKGPRSLMPSQGLRRTEIHAVFLEETTGEVWGAQRNFSLHATIGTGHRPWGYPFTYQSNVVTVKTGMLPGQTGIHNAYTCNR